MRVLIKEFYSSLLLSILIVGQKIIMMMVIIISTTLQVYYYLRTAHDMVYDLLAMGQVQRSKLVWSISEPQQQ